MRLGWQQSNQLLESPRSAQYRAHLDPVTEQHDVDERRSFPEEHRAAKAEDDGRAVEIGHADRKADERHHARQPVSQLGHQSC